jgi:photosystem II stability/assembly factor-like uncharacterized protein
MSDQIALSTRKGLLLLNRTEAGWQIEAEHFLGSRVSLTGRDPRTQMLIACLDDGHFGCKIRRSTDNGGTWLDDSAPKYPEGTEVKPGVPASLKYLWALGFGHADQPGRMYVGTQPGGLFISDDSGASWTLCESLWNEPTRMEGWFGGGRDDPAIHSILVDPRDSQRIAVGISCAGMFLSEDGGATWKPKNKGLKADFLPSPDTEVGHDPHLLVACENDPDKLWQQNHCGIFRSTDSGENWTDVSDANGPAGFGFCVVVDPHDGDTAWVVPAESDQVRVAVNRRLCVCRTTDGGQNWQTLTQGLPDKDCYDFAYRHSLDQSGDMLALGTVSGSFYWSEDRGETWQTFGKDLPQIYAVKFV